MERSELDQIMKLLLSVYRCVYTLLGRDMHSDERLLVFDFCLHSATCVRYTVCCILR